MRPQARETRRRAVQCAVPSESLVVVAQSEESARRRSGACHALDIRAALRPAVASAGARAAQGDCAGGRVVWAERLGSGELSVEGARLPSGSVHPDATDLRILVAEDLATGRRTLWSGLWEMIYELEGNDLQRPGTPPSQHIPSVPQQSKAPRSRTWGLSRCSGRCEAYCLVRAITWLALPVPRRGFPQVRSCPQGLTRFGHRLYGRHELMFVHVRGRRSW